MLVSACAPAARALETDQYYAWGRELADATDIVNAKINVEIADVLERVNRRPSRDRMSCHDVVKRIVPRFRQFVFQDIEMWMVNASLVPRIPATPAEELEFRKRYLYRVTGPLDLGTKVPPSPTIELNGVRVGTDKLAHFFSGGFWYYKWYRKAVRSGSSPAEAEWYAIRRGIFPEKTILGLLASGVFSIGDLEANHKGMRFLVGLCDGDSPGLQRTADGWRQTTPFDARDFVTPEWDESYHPPVFSRRRWKKVRPVLLEYCPLLRDPWVVRQRREYASRDATTLTDLRVRELVEAGELKDPRQFSIECNCPEPDISLVRQATGGDLSRASCAP